MRHETSNIFYYFVVVRFQAGAVVWFKGDVERMSDFTLTIGRAPFLLRPQKAEALVNTPPGSIYFCSFHFLSFDVFDELT